MNIFTLNLKLYRPLSHLEGPVQGLVRLVPSPAHLQQRLGVEDGEVAACNINMDIASHL